MAQLKRGKPKAEAELCFPADRASLEGLRRVGQRFYKGSGFVA